MDTSSAATNTDFREPTAAEAQALAAYAEQLQQGINVVASSTDRGDSVLSENLLQCLQRLERRWPSEPRAAQDSLPARVGRFEIERLLGQGGFGIVYLASDPLLQRQVALKVPRWHVLHSESLRERFRREGRATAALDHPGIVPIHELGDGGGLCYIAFAYCEGPSLAEWLRSRGEPVAPRIAARLIEQLASAMHYSHSRGVLHRDLKPNNVLLFPTVATEHYAEEFPFTPRIVDFGLARLAQEEREATGSSGVVGTPLYMAPEQALGDPARVGPAADVYSLGTMLYELLSGQPPFPGTTPLEVLDQVRHAEPRSLRQQRPDIPRDLETICLHCLAKQPADRYASALELASDLQRYVAGDHVHARPASLGLRILRICQQPQRVREAGLTIIATHTAVILSMALTLYMVHSGEVVERPVGFRLSTWAPGALMFMVSGHAPMVFIGWMVLQRRPWAAWISLIAGVSMVLVSLLFIFGWIPAGMTNWDEIPGFRIFYPMMTVLLLLQSVMSAIAVIALQRSPPEPRTQ